MKIKGLQKNFVDNTYVTSVQKLCRGHGGEGLENGHTDQGDGGVGDGGNEGFEGNEVECLNTGGGGALCRFLSFSVVSSLSSIKCK